MPELTAAPAAATAPPPRPATSQSKPRSGRPPAAGKVSRRSTLRRRVDSAGDALASLASAGDSPSGSDRVLAQAFSRLERLGAALRRVSEELAVERRRTSALREEVRRLRAELQSGRRTPSAG
jgi:hypothetical protein